MNTTPLITVGVPSYNQGKFLDEALSSIFKQNLPLEVFVADGGSTDNSVDIIRKWEGKLAGWRSHRDSGQSAAINECIAKGRAPYVCWLNSDDIFLPDKLTTLLENLEAHPERPMAYGNAWNVKEGSQRRSPVWVEPFDQHRLAIRCIISQPATLMRRTCWEAVGGLDETLHMAMDYDLWWRLFKQFGPLGYVDEFVAINREHTNTKTRNFRRQNYQAAIKIVRQHYGRVPLKWWIAQPYTVWLRSLLG